MTNRIFVALRPETPKSTHTAVIYDGTNLTDVAWFFMNGEDNYQTLRIYANGIVSFVNSVGETVEFRKGEFLVRDRETYNVVAMSASEFHRKYTEDVEVS